ncbi:hypothetical protein [Cohnella soli]|uniref:Uncharacterized protein n=1 Tax=Cohnella soli TaxID=425005 RepID=A0ABW0HUR0_9BACL
MGWWMAMVGKVLGVILKACSMTSLVVCASIGLVAGAAYAQENGSAGPTGQEATSPAASQALTLAPDVEPYSIFNPNHLYLDSGSVNASLSGSTLTALATTSANTTVDTIGITFYLQKWNGTTWDTVGAGTMKSDTSKSTYSSNQSYSLTAGYYYRVQTTHWIIKGSVYEEGTRTSNTVLAS